MIDQEIVESVLSGKKDDFELIVDRYWEKLNRYCSRLLNYNEQDSQDAVSNTFLKIYQNLAGYNPNLKFSSWVYRIAHNESVNIIRKNSNFFSFDPLSSSLQAFIGKADVNISRLEIEKILSKLNASDRNILILFHIEELSINEISEILKASPGSVKSRLSIARNKARKILKD